MALDGDDDDEGIKVNLQLVGSEAGPGSLGGFWLVNLLLSGHGPLHVHAVSCSNKTICILREIQILVFQCVKLMNKIFWFLYIFIFFLYYRFFFKKREKKKKQHSSREKGNLQPNLNR